MSEDKQERPRREASDPEKQSAPDDEVPPGTEGAAEDACPECGGSGRLEDGLHERAAYAARPAGMEQLVKDVAERKGDEGSAH